jgi:hypothetical protein
VVVLLALVGILDCKIMQDRYLKHIMTETGTEVAVHGKGSGYLESFSGEGMHLCFRLVPMSVDCVSGTLHALGLKVDLGGPAMSFMAYLHEVIVDNNIDFSIRNGSGSSNWSRVRVWGSY